MGGPAERPAGSRYRTIPEEAGGRRIEHELGQFLSPEFPFRTRIGKRVATTTAATIAAIAIAASSGHAAAVRRAQGRAAGLVSPGAVAASGGADGGAVSREAGPCPSAPPWRRALGSGSGGEGSRQQLIEPAHQATDVGAPALVAELQRVPARDRPHLRRQVLAAWHFRAGDEHGIGVTSGRRRAVSTSSRTKSSGSAIRWVPFSSSIVAHLGPMTTISTWHAATASVIRSTKSTPTAMSTSMNTFSSPNRATIAS